MKSFLQAHRYAAYAALLSFLCTAWVPLVNSSRTGDLSNWYSDDLHHPFATWVALTQGTQVYTVPFKEVFSRKDSGFPHEAIGST